MTTTFDSHRSMAIPMRRGLSDSLHSTTSHTQPFHGEDSQQQHQWRFQSNRYNPYEHSQALMEREASIAKRRKTERGIHLTIDQYAHRSYDSSSAGPETPYSARQSQSPSSMPIIISPGSVESPQQQSWQWSKYPAHQDDRLVMDKVNVSTSDGSATTLARTAKQSGRHQRKRSAGCLNCHTIWSPTWRKDSKGSMRCNACGLYLAARGQERPLALIPKRKQGSSPVGEGGASEFSKSMVSPREEFAALPLTHRYSHGHLGSAYHHQQQNPHSHHHHQQNYPHHLSPQDEPTYPPYYPSSNNSEHSSSVRPSPSFSMQSLGRSPETSSIRSVPTRDHRAYSTAHSSEYQRSPSTSPLTFDSLSLEPMRPRAGTMPNTLGLRGIDRATIEEYPQRHSREGSGNGAISHGDTLPSPRSDWKLEQEQDREGHSPLLRTLSEQQQKPHPNSTEFSRLTLPPLSELTRKLSPWRPARHHASFSSQDRRQTELLDVNLARGGNRVPSH